MGHGAFQRFLATMASAGTLTGQIDLGRSFYSVKIEVPARSNTTLYIQAASDSSGTFRRVFAEGNATTVPVLFQLASATTNVIVPIPGGYRYLKVESQDAINDGAVFRIVCADT